MNEKVEKRNFDWQVGVGQVYGAEKGNCCSMVAVITVSAFTATSAAHKAKLEASCQGIVDPKIVSVSCAKVLEIDITNRINPSTEDTMNIDNPDDGD